MNRAIIYIFAALTIMHSIDMDAQKPNEDKKFNLEAYESKKGAFLTAELGLTPEEAAEFIPLCNELQRKKFEVGRACRHKHKHVRMSKIANKEISTDAYKEVMNACLESRIKEAELEKEYYAKFLQILPPEKLYKYKDAEMKFWEKYMKERHKKKE